MEQPQHTEQPQNNQFAYYQSYSYQNLPSYDYSAYSSSTPANADYSGYSNADYSGYSEGHSTSQQEQQPRGNFDEDELGFGNSSLSRSKSVPASLQQQQQQHSQSTPQPKPGTEADDSTRNEISESSYMALLRGFGSLFRREGGKNASAANGAGGGGPIVAKLGEKNNFRYDEKLKRWVNDSATSGDTSSTPNKIEPPPISRPPSAPPFAPPSTPMSLSANVSRAPSPAPYVPPMGGSFSQISSPAGPETPVRRASTQRKNARSRYVDPLNPDMQDTPSFDRGSSSFIPTPSVVGASVPRIMTPAPKGTEMK